MMEIMKGLKEGARYRVLKPCRLDGWIPVYGGWRGTGMKVEPGTVLVYRGTRYGVGVDDVHYNCFEPEAGYPENTEGKPQEFWPNVWGCVPSGYLEPVEGG